MKHCYIRKKAALLSLLMMICVLNIMFFSCTKKPEDKVYEYESIPYGKNMNLSYERSTLKTEKITIVFYDVKAEIEEDKEREDLINGIFSEWKSLTEKTALLTVNEFRLDYFEEAQTVKMEAENEITFLDGGLVSIACRLKYSCFGNDYSVFVGGKVIDLNTGRILSYRDILKCDKVLIENILTNGFAGQFPPGFNESVVGLGGNFADNCGIIIENGDLVFYLRAEEMSEAEKIFSVPLSIKGNEKYFRYDISN